MSEVTSASNPKPVDARHAYSVQVGDNNVQVTTVVERAPGADAPPPTEWPLLRDVQTPLHLGVHPTTPGRTGEPPLPPYVPRDSDAAVHDALRTVAGPGGLVLVLGESTAGKSRCAFEAARSVIPDHRLLHVPPQALLSGLQNIPDGMSVVVWLDDLEQYLGPTRLTAPWLRLMRQKGVVLLATMRVEEYSRLRSGLDGEGHRLAGDDVLRQADQVVRLERRWSSAELARARGFEDSRLTEALTRSDEYGLGEYLAAGPDLMTAWLNGWAPGAHPRGAALVAASVDLRRAGVRAPLPLSMLEQLHGHYLRGRGGARLRPEPLPQALEWATAQVRATTSLLLPTDSEGHITVFDYLVDTTQRDAAASPVPEVIWDAALQIVAESERADVAEAAISEEQYDIAEGIFRELLEVGYQVALLGLCRALLGQGRPLEAEEFLQEQLIATVGDPQRHALCKSLLGVVLCIEERFAEAEIHLRETLATEFAFPGVGVYLGTILISQEKYAEAESLLRPSAEGGDADACRVLGNALDGQGRRDEALPWFVKAAEAGDREAMVILGLAAKDDRDLVAAEKWLRKAYSLGGSSMEIAGAFLAMILSAQSRFTEAEPFWRAVIETGGSPLAAHHLGQALLAQDRAGEAEPWLVQATEDGYEGRTEARVLLGRALVAQGRADEALRWWREAAADGSSEAAYRIGFHLLDESPSEGAEWLERAAQAGESIASSRLGVHYAETGQYEKAHKWLAQAATAGVPKAAYLLGMLLSQQERSQDAEEWLEKAVELGVAEAAEHLAALRAQAQAAAVAQQNEQRAGEAFAAGLRLRDAGQPDQSEASFRSAAEMGHADAAMMLGVALINRGSGNEGMAWLRGAAESGRSSGAALTLALLLKQEGNLDEAESWLRRAEEGGQSSAAAELGKLLHGLDRRDEAELWLRKAAEAGDAEAAGILGVQLKDQGRTEEAWAMLYQAATTGYALAATVLGLMCLEQGHEDAAIKWWQYAAQAGDPIGAHTLGAVWEQRGRLQDALAMYTLAAEKGHTDAIAALNRLRTFKF